jgi:hypothetical protein
MSGPLISHYTSWAIPVVNIIIDIIVDSSSHSPLVAVARTAAVVVAVTVSVMAEVEQNFLILYIFCATFLYTQIYFHLTVQYIVFDAPTCFGHKPQPSSGRYSTWGHVQRVMKLVSRKGWIIHICAVSSHNELTIVKIVLKIIIHVVYWKLCKVLYTNIL